MRRELAALFLPTRLPCCAQTRFHVIEQTPMLWFIKLSQIALHYALDLLHIRRIRVSFTVPPALELYILHKHRPICWLQREVSRGGHLEDFWLWQAFRSLATKLEPLSQYLKRGIRWSVYTSNETVPEQGNSARLPVSFFLTHLPRRLPLKRKVNSYSA